MEKLTVVSTAAALPNVTVPGPLTRVQVVVTAAGGFGSPSSVTVPSSVATPGKVIVWSGPALTDGAWLAALTVIVISSAAVKRAVARGQPQHIRARGREARGRVDSGGIAERHRAGTADLVQVVVTGPADWATRHR